MVTCNNNKFILVVKELLNGYLTTLICITSMCLVALQKRMNFLITNADYIVEVVCIKLEREVCWILVVIIRAGKQHSA